MLMGITLYILYIFFFFFFLPQFEPLLFEKYVWVSGLVDV